MIYIIIIPSILSDLKNCHLSSVIDLNVTLLHCYNVTICLFLNTVDSFQALFFNICLSILKRLTLAPGDSCLLSLRWLTLFLRTLTSYGYCLLFICFCLLCTENNVTIGRNECA